MVSEFSKETPIEAKRDESFFSSINVMSHLKASINVVSHLKASINVMSHFSGV